MPTLTTLASFNGTNGEASHAPLAIDSAGDLFGTTSGGTGNNGSVFELADTNGTYASTPTALFIFDGTHGANPYGGLSIDAAGDLIGTTENGGSNGYGTIFEMPKISAGFAATPTLLASINANSLASNGTNPFGAVITDAAGNLLTTTVNGGANGLGSIIELGSTHGGTVTPTTIVSFSAATGINPFGTLVADASGNLYGTTYMGGANNDGTVFEIGFANGTYASTPTVLANLGTATGVNPYAGLTIDSAGNLFGVAQTGGANNSGTIFELAKTTGGYAAPTVLASFNGSDGYDPAGGLLIDTKGNLYGTTVGGGDNGDGTVFELSFANGAYASTPTVLASFSSTTGINPYASLTADANGNLFGTTVGGGAGGDGTVFEVSGIGFTGSTPLTTATDIPVIALYQAALGRLPDAAGLHSWDAVYEANPASLTTTIATAFVASAEFQAKYGTLDSTAFVTQLYENVVDRAPDPGGLAFWTGELNSGAMTQGQVLAGIADSAENLANYSGVTISLTSAGTDIVSTGGGVKVLFAPTGGSNAITGGPGMTTLVFSGAESSYTVTPNSDGSVTVSNSSVTDHVSNVGYLQFSDHHTVAAVDTNDIMIAALYQAALGRSADLTGLQYWENLYVTGVPASVQASGTTIALAQYTPAALTTSIAGAFIASTEFQSAFGASLNNPSDFVSLLYENVLDRAPDQAGATFWTGELTSGAMTQPMVLVGFAESAENLAKFSSHAILIA